MTFREAPLPMQLPPSEAIRQLADMLEPGIPRMILDAGSGSARNAGFLAQQGHIVIALDSQFREAQLAASQLRTVAPEVHHPWFVVADLQQRPVFSRLFDIVLCNEVLHMLTKPASRRLLNSLRAQTKQGGLNVVSDYLLHPGTGNNRNRERCLHPDELASNYERAGWQILDYRESNLPLQMRGSQEIVSSQATIFAQRPWALK